MKKPKEKNPPLKEKEIEKLKNLSCDFGVETKEEEFDEILYEE